MPARRTRGVIVGVLAVAVASCAGGGSKSAKRSTTTTTKPSGATASTPRGIALTPRTYDVAGFTELFELAPKVGKVLAWSGDWAELDAAHGAAATLAAQATSRHLTPVYAVSPFNQSTRSVIRPLDDATTARYRDDAVAFAKRRHPPFLGFGVEVNLMADSIPIDFDRFVTLFAEVAKAVRRVSPHTLVFTSFQLEWMAGDRAGVFGHRNDPSTAQWSLLDRFPDADLIAFTTYPGLVFQRPSDVPADYYAQIAQHTSKRVAFTEIGWPADPALPGWPDTEAAQAEFAGRFLDGVAPLHPAFLVWSFLYPTGPAPFTSMSLRRSDGSARPVWSTWATAVDDD